MSDIVQRWELDSTLMMNTVDDGNYVLYEDYQSLTAERDNAIKLAADKLMASELRILIYDHGWGKATKAEVISILEVSDV